jgi:hypothetical protein
MRFKGKIGHTYFSRRQALCIAGLAVSEIALCGCGRNEPEAVPMAEVKPQPEFVDVPPLPFTWRAIASGDQGPGQRSRHCLAFEQQAKVMVFFGGVVWDKPHVLKDDTWELRAGKWSKIEPGEAPPPCHRGAMVYDSNLGACLLFGGQGNWNQMFGDTWTYSNQQWQNRSKWFASSPSRRCGHSMAFDKKAGVTVLFGGVGAVGRSLQDTWVYDGNQWESIDGPAPPARRYAALAYDPQLEGCLLQGGSKDDYGKEQLIDSWLFSNRRWKRMPPAFHIDARDDMGMAYHKSAKRLVMLDGLRGDRGVLVRDSAGWKKRETKPLHPRLQCSPLVWDETQDGLVMHGGEVGQGARQYGFTWVLKRVEKEKA